MDNGENDRFLVPHEDVYGLNSDGSPFMLGHAHTFGGEFTADEVKVHLAEIYEDDPNNFQVIPPREQAQKRSQNVGRRVFGFSNWNGCQWEPQGPQGDPSLN